jgi:hypothetical protein
LVEAEPPLGDYAIDFQYLLLNERAYSKEQLLTIRNIVSTLFLAEGHYDIALLERELLNLYDQELDKQAVSLFLNWFRQLALYGKVSPEDYEKLDVVYRTKEEVQTMLVTALAKERQQIYQQGKVEGQMEAQHRTIEQLLNFRFELDETEQHTFTHEVAQIQNLQQLDELVDTLLNKTVQLADFTRLLKKYLPADITE